MSATMQPLRASSPVARLARMNSTDPSVPLQALHDWHVGMASALAHIEQPDALGLLAQALGTLAPIDSVMISLERKDRPPQLLYQHGIPEAYQDAVLNRYFTVGYLLDPFCLAVESGLAEGFYTLADIAPDNFFDSDYYKTYYLKVGCSEDSYYIVNLDDYSKISVSLFQGMGADSLCSEQLSVLRAVEPLVRLFVSQFGRIELQRQPALTEPETFAENTTTDVNQRIQAAFAQFGCDVLTEREREVAHMVLRGHSIKSTAREMGISPETVRMHRKNLYVKRGINSQSELFAQFIEWLQQG
ncbi:helix-turn-helix transcriptional regulator [Pseudomonas sp. NA-150]|uniref:helix-turn-helix domain-containing protein n=1 Tax=Pseudomonas sp. NA-150 TaxID=3367525 RepID=UPI0037C5BAFF